MSSHIRRGVALLFLFAAFAAPASAADQPIRLDNYQPNETIRYPVALLVGSLADASLTEVRLTNASSKRPTAHMSGQAANGQFKVLAELVPGENKLSIAAGDASLAVTITYKPQTNPYVVRIIYMTDSTGETKYDTQRPDDPQHFAAKLDTAAKLMQTFTAERLHDLGYGRRTFNLELDDAGKVKVHVVKGKRPADEYYKLDDQAWYRVVSSEMNDAFDMKRAKNIVVAAYTRWDPAAGKPKGHTALGGGNQGLFGSGNVFTWPSSLADAQPAFMDATRMDKSKVQDDSAGRGTFWGAASTTIGATLHEMGHAFDLPHTKVGFDIMTRGFDRFNRAFTVVEPGRRAGPDGKPRPFKQEDIAAFAPVSAESLLTSRWFALDDRQYAERNDVKISLDAAKEEVVIRSAVGVRYVSASVKGDAAFFTSPPRDAAAPNEFRVPLADVRKAIPEGEVNFRAVNADGHAARVTLSRLKEQAKS